MPGYSCRVERFSREVGKPENKAITWVIRFPRRVLAETVTHRLTSDTWGEWEVSCTERTATEDVSKNSASSRAIPFTRMLQDVRDDPFMPQWTKNQKGMQGDPLDEPAIRDRANSAWRDALTDMIGHAQYLSTLGVHKQDCNRLLEPFAWTTQVLTMTRPDNFFALRTHQAADPHFRTIARMMYLAMIDSTPEELSYGQWHLPFIPPNLARNYRWEPPLDHDGKLIGVMPSMIQHSTARCAWVSYNNHDQDAGTTAMEATYGRLLAEVPVHASPVEHQLTPMPLGLDLRHQHLISNCKGWLQARKLIPLERIDKFTPSEGDVSRWRDEVRPWYKGASQ